MDALVILTAGPGEYATAGWPVVHELRRRFGRVILAAAERTREVAEFFGGFDRGYFLSDAQLADGETFNRLATESFAGPCTLFNLSPALVPCVLAAQLRARGMDVGGVYYDAKAYRATTEAGLDLIDLWTTGRVPRGAALRLLPPRSRMLAALGFADDGKPHPKLPPHVPAGGDPAAAKRIAVDCAGDGSFPSRRYPHGAELAAELAREGFEPVDVSGGAMGVGEIAARIAGCAAVIACDGLAAELAAQTGAPLLGLFSSTDPENAGAGKNYVRCVQPCQPCAAPVCECARAGESCLEEVSPAEILGALKKTVFISGPGALEIPRPAALRPGTGGAAHVVCIHGLGDALRYALPLACSLGRAGRRATLHVRAELVSCIGEQRHCRVVPVVLPPETAPAEWARRHLMRFGPVEEAVVLGGSAYDEALVKALDAVRTPVWGLRRDPGFPRFTGPGGFWTNLPEHEKNLALLCRLHGVEPAPAHERALNPDPAFAEHPFKNPARPLVGVHGTARWAARSYPHAQRLVELLSERYTVWNFDAAPCDDLAQLAWIIRSSRAVLTVNTLVLHLAGALECPTLLIQGPVWLHPENAPYVIPFTRTTARPCSLGRIDPAADALAQVAPGRVAEEFLRFAEARDRSPWASGPLNA